MFHEDDEDYRKAEEFFADLKNRKFGRVWRFVWNTLIVAAVTTFLTAIFLLALERLAGP